MQKQFIKRLFSTKSPSTTTFVPGTITESIEESNRKALLNRAVPKSNEIYLADVVNGIKFSFYFPF